ISLVGVDDLAQAVILSINKNDAAGKMYYVTDGTRYLITEIERAIYRAWGKKMPSWHTPHMVLYAAATAAGWVNYIFFVVGAKRQTAGSISARTYRNLVTDNLFSNEKLCEELGFKPVCNFYEALPRVVESIDRQAWLKEPG
ncbi:uncharacterized protein METZ01_LOCUS278435, partial [marine metagenome]